MTDRPEGTPEEDPTSPELEEIEADAAEPEIEPEPETEPALEPAPGVEPARQPIDPEDAVVPGAPRARGAATRTLGPSEQAVHIRDRVSALFVILTLAVFGLILAYALLFGRGGVISGTPTPRPEPSPVATEGPAATGSPAAGSPSPAASSPSPAAGSPSPAASSPSPTASPDEASPSPS